MELNRIFSAEQISVKPELPGILKDYSKALIRENPDDIYLLYASGFKFSADYFRQKAGGVGGEPWATVTRPRRACRRDVWVGCGQWRLASGRSGAWRDDGAAARALRLALTFAIFLLLVFTF